MLKFLAHDAINDIALIQTNFCYWVRYGLQQKKFDTAVEARSEFCNCLHHAIECAGHLEVEE